jgi:hypothetical protein
LREMPMRKNALGSRNNVSTGAFFLCPITNILYTKPKELSHKD